MRDVYSTNSIYSMSERESIEYLTEQLNDGTAVDVY